jgi:hypothetical protein
MLGPIWEMRSTRTRQFTTFDQATGEKTRNIAPGARAVIAQADGPGVITRIWFTFPGWFHQYWNPGFPVDPTILRKLILRIWWDGQPEPSVQAPLGDFFGVGHCEYRHWTSRYLGMSSGGFYCYLPMPFSSVRMEVENLHESMEALVFANVTWESGESLPPDAGRFHCTWRQAENPGPDPVTILETEGRGRFTGCCLSLQGRDPNYLAYLEAPEYVYIDGEPEPAIVGTGLEDYFNGGWYFRDQEFTAPLHGVPLKDPLRAMVSAYRFHEHDAISFQRSIRFEFRNPWKPERLKPFRWSSTAYWYQDRAVAVRDRLPPREELARLYRIRDVDHQSQP